MYRGDITSQCSVVCQDLEIFFFGQDDVQCFIHQRKIQYAVYFACCLRVLSHNFSDAFRLSLPSQLVIGNHWLAFLNQVRKILCVLIFKKAEKNSPLENSGISFLVKIIIYLLSYESWQSIIPSSLLTYYSIHCRVLAFLHFLQPWRL